MGSFWSSPEPSSASAPGAHLEQINSHPVWKLVKLVIYQRQVLVRSVRERTMNGMTLAHAMMGPYSENLDVLEEILMEAVELVVRDTRKNGKQGPVSTKELLSIIATGNQKILMAIEIWHDIEKMRKAARELDLEIRSQMGAGADDDNVGWWNQQ